MRYLKVLALMGAFLVAAPYAHAQRVAIGVGVGPVGVAVGGPAYIGPAPVCDYGYYDYYPYACAPCGYYGPSWFSGGVFIGAGPWFHGYYGGRGFYGRGFYGRPGFAGRGGFVGRGGFARGPVGGFRGGAVGHGAVSG
ncbi:MAG: hypothetical protein WAM96_19960, partial [Candidatus Acidiferrales bacterium]